MKSIASITSVLLFATLSTLVLAQNVEVKDAWARSSVPGQRATGAFMKLIAKEDIRLIAASSRAAGVVEVHEMKMEGDVMKMRALPGGLELPAGKTVELKPGGFHVMLMDLKAPLAKDSTIALTLIFKDSKGIEKRMEVMVPVALAAPGGGVMTDHTQRKM